MTGSQPRRITAEVIALIARDAAEREVDRMLAAESDPAMARALEAHRPTFVARVVANTLADPRILAVADAGDGQTLH